MNALISLLAMLPAQAAPDEATPATMAEVVASLERTEAAIANLSVTTEYEKLQRPDVPPATDLIRLRMTTAFIIDRDGRTRYECVGQQVNYGPKGVTTYRGRWRSTFDGEVATTLTGGDDGSFHSAELSGSPHWHGVNPREYTTHYFQQPASVWLKRRAGRVVGREGWESRRVTVAESEPKDVDGTGWKYRFWVDVERGVVVRRAGLIRYPDQDWREYTRIESRAHEEVRPGVWLPDRFQYESLHNVKAGGPEQISWRFDGRNLGWEANRTLPEGTFRLVPPPDLNVKDHRPAEEKARAKANAAK